MNQAQKDVLDELGASYRVVSIRPRTLRPETLYHYTSSRGLLGIISSGVLRAGNFSYLNDSSELLYGIQLVERVFKERLASVSNVTTRRVLNVVQDDLRKADQWLDFYTACFCARPDLLSQWRAYGTANGRFCIGFDSEQLYEMSPECILKRVVYEESEQSGLVQAALERSVEAVSRGVSGLSHEEEWDQFEREVTELLAKKLAGFLSSFKHPGFKEEKEWRLVHVADADSDIQFDAKGGLLKPYVTLSCKHRDGSGSGRLPLKEVIVGAGVFSVQGIKSVELLLRKYGYTEVEVRRSAVPFRDV